MDLTNLKRFEKEDIVIKIFDSLSQEQRVDLIANIRVYYCLNCGRPQPPMTRCQCWNDE